MLTLRNVLKHSILTHNLVMQAELPIRCIQRSFYNNQYIKKIFLKSIEAVNTKKLIEDNVKLNNEFLTICDRNYSLKNDVYLIGFGKAVFNMATELEAILGTNLKGGIVSIPTGTLSTDTNRKMAEKSKITFYEGAKDNIPDFRSVYTAEEISKFVQSLQKNDLLIVLISGGGSALLPLPIQPIHLSEKSELVKKLSNNGADIFELNTVRKRISQLKGGGLARKTYPAYIVSLILSDVIGDPLDIIASGPTLPNNDKPNDAIEIIKKYGLLGDISKDMLKILKSPKETYDIPLNPLGSYFHVENNLIGNNQIMAKAARCEAVRNGYEAIIISTHIFGDVAKIANAFAQVSADLAEYMMGQSSHEFLSIKYEQEKLLNLKKALPEILKLNFENKKGICLIAAGEPTIHVKGKGKGGRNQHMALQFSTDLHVYMKKNSDLKYMNVAFLSCGTDGIDGPTDAAGAIGTSNLYSLAVENDLEPERFLRNCDSYSFYEKFMGGEYMVKTGHTGTNVMDLHLVIINKGYSDGNIECIKTRPVVDIPIERC